MTGTLVEPTPARASSQLGSVERGTELVGYRTNDTDLTATLREGDGTLRESSHRFLVGADGARSVVRHLTGTPFPGSRYAPTAFLADVRLHPALEKGTVGLHLAHGGFVGVLDLGDGWYRLFGALPREYGERIGTRDGNADAEQLQGWFDAYFQLPAKVLAVRWTSTYRIRHGLAERFGHGQRSSSPGMRPTCTPPPGARG